MPPKRRYEVGESSNSRAISAEAKARRQAYLDSWRNLMNHRDNEVVNPTPPQIVEEPRPPSVPVPLAPEKSQESDDDSESDTKEGYIVTSAGEKVQFKWGRCIGVGSDPEGGSEEDDEEDPEEESEEDPEEDLKEESEEDPEEAPEEQQEDPEESEEDPDEAPDGEAEGELEGEDEGEYIEEFPEEEDSEGPDNAEEDEVWEIEDEDQEPLEENEDEGIVDEPEAIERQPDEWELSGSEYDGFPSDDDIN